MARVTKDMLIGDAIQVDQGIISLLMSTGMHCVTCYASQMESLEEAAWVHGIDPDELVDYINEYLEVKEASMQ